MVSPYLEFSCRCQILRRRIIVGDCNFIYKVLFKKKKKKKIWSKFHNINIYSFLGMGTWMFTDILQFILYNNPKYFPKFITTANFSFLFSLVSCFGHIHLLSLWIDSFRLCHTLCSLCTVNSINVDWTSFKWQMA